MIINHSDAKQGCRALVYNHSKCTSGRLLCESHNLKPTSATYIYMTTVFKQLVTHAASVEKRTSEAEFLERGERLDPGPPLANICLVIVCRAVPPAAAVGKYSSTIALRQCSRYAVADS